MRCILYTLIETRSPLRSNVIHVRDFVLLFTYLHAGHILEVSRGWRCIALISGYICRFYDDKDVKILKMIYIKNNKENTKEK
jgi:hypothetical protein